jgi:hypothetical protein
MSQARPRAVAQCRDDFRFRPFADAVSESGVMLGTTTCVIRRSGIRSAVENGATANDDVVHLASPARFSAGSMSRVGIGCNRLCCIAPLPQGRGPERSVEEGAPSLSRRRPAPVVGRGRRLSPPQSLDAGIEVDV